MDTSFPLSSETYSIGGRNYRKTGYQLKAVPSTDRHCLQTDQFEDTPDVYEDEPSTGCLAPQGLPVLKKNNVTGENLASERNPKEVKYTATESTEDSRIQVIDGKKWLAYISVPCCFLGKMIGTNRRTLNTLENDTQCRIKTPRREDSGPCEITSIVSMECVQRCLDRIEIFIDDVRKSARVSHFVAFPCDNQEVQENFNIFKQLVMDNEHIDVSCKNPQLFTKASRLHLTLSVVRIFDDNDLQKASDAFKQLELEIKDLLGSAPLVADIRGIDMMNDDASQVSVIYAKVGGERVQDIANHVNRRLVEFGISKNPKNDEKENVRLHLTLMNSRYVAQAEKSGNARNGKMTFDANVILEELKDSYFGTIQLSEICLCPLNSNSTSSNGKFYDKISTIKIT